MSNTKSNIQNVFGKFAVELENGAQLFDTLEEAQLAETKFLKGAEFRNEAAAFNAFAKNEGKNAKGKANVLVAYFEWVALGRPEPEVEEEVVADEAADETVAVDETVADDAEPALDADGTVADTDF